MNHTADFSIDGSSNLNENLGFPSQMTEQRINEVILGTENTHIRRQEPLFRDNRNRSAVNPPEPDNRSERDTESTQTIQTDLSAALVTLMEQNRILIERLTQADKNPVQTSHVPGYFAIPDLKNTLSDFSGKESCDDARTWLKSFENTAKFQNWPEIYKLEFIHTKLSGPARNWYVGRTFTNWASFIDQFTGTFIGTAQRSTVDLYK